jgi:DNA-binding protein H-NS
MKMKRIAIEVIAYSAVPRPEEHRGRDMSAPAPSWISRSDQTWTGTGKTSSAG